MRRLTINLCHCEESRKAGRRSNLLEMRLLRLRLAMTLIVGLFPISAWAGKQNVAPAGPSAEEQQKFTKDFWDAKEAGGDAYQKFSSDVTNKGTNEQGQMLNNLEHGKAADGSEAKGFHGDSTDSGPTDWSKYDIQTDDKGNVTGFKLKDFDQIDTNHDGKLSDDEIAAWKKKQDEENKKKGGPPGFRPPKPPPGVGANSKPLGGFSLMCYQCNKLPSTAKQTEEIRCHGSEEGPCTANACPSDQECEQYAEKSDKGESYYCHNCNEKPIDNCAQYGYSSDGNCDGKCAQGDLCVPVDIDKNTGNIVPSNATREKGTPLIECFACKHTGYIEVTYVVLIIETPYVRVVLNRTQDPNVFKPASVMALAKVDPSTGMIPNVNGDLRKITDFMGGFNVGFGPGGLTTTGSVSMDQLTSALKSNLSSGGSYGANCFDNVQRDADKQAASAGTPTSKDISEGKAGKQDRGKTDKALAEDKLKAAEGAGAPAVSGPVVACGTQDGNKVLKIYDAGGNLIDSITQTMLRADPNIILEKLGVAQNFTNKLMLHTNFDFAGLVEKFTGLPLKEMQAVAGTIESVKSPIDQALHSKRRNKSNDQGPIVPNDPLYQAAQKKNRSFLGIFGSDAPTGPSAFLMGQPAYNVVEGGTPNLDVKDQYYLRTIGYTPLSDPNSAWNVVDATQKNMVVALIDSGLDLSHPDGPQYLWANPKDGTHGWNFVNENTDFTDYRGHGTFVAGIIAAKWNNGIGIAGINPGAVIMPIKVTNDKGETDSLAVWRGINFAVNHGAKIINLSIGGKTISKLEEQAIERANALGTLVVIAAGNINESLMTFGPASSRYALTVGMVDFGGQRSLVSNWGPNLQLTAPGEQIWSLCSKDTKDALPSVRKYGYFRQSGTSFSTPMVTATASLIWAKNPQLTGQQVADIIRKTATPINRIEWSDRTGFGLLNAAAALRSTTDDKLLAMITNMHFNRDMRGRLTSLDVYGTVRGEYKEFIIEAGRGKQPLGFRKIAGPFQGQYNYQLIARLVIHDVLRGSDEWVLRLKVIDQQGKEHIASTAFIFPDK